MAINSESIASRLPIYGDFVYAMNHKTFFFFFSRFSSLLSVSLAFLDFYYGLTA